MRFKDYLRMAEVTSSTDHGLMGAPVASSVRKPSDGQPFKQFLGCFSGQNPKLNAGGGGGDAAGGPGAAPGAAPKPFMKKKMNKA